MLANKITSQLITRTVDTLSIFASLFLAYEIRFEYPVNYNELIYLSIIAILVFQLSSSFTKVYKSWRGSYGFSLIRSLIINWATTGLILLAILTLAKKGEDFSRLWLIYWWGSTLILLIINKAIIYSLAAKFRSLGINVKSIAVIGNAQSIRTINKKLGEARWSGFITTQEIDVSLTKEIKVNSIEKNVDEIWIALPVSSGEITQKIMRDLRNNTQNIRLIPSISDLRLLNHKVNQVAGLQLIDLSVSTLDEGINAAIKRLFDICFSIIALICISPILLLISFVVKLTTPGPALFKQDRNGLHGKKISVYKFRSMHTHKEDGSITQATKNDSRITPIGQFLRKSSLDELPQFINVLQGKMSVVGPRPHAIPHNEEYREIVDSYMRRHKVKPGITGWAQINGYRGETDTLDKMEKRVEFDLFYIDNWSIWFDIKIVVMTIFKGFFDKNAY